MSEQQEPGPREEFEGEGQGAEELSPEIEEEGDPGQTEHEPPDDDVNE
jgi:hypothetical protein